MPQLTDRSKLPNIVDPVVKDTMDLKHLYQVCKMIILTLLGFATSGSESPTTRLGDCERPPMELTYPSRCSGYSGRKATSEDSPSPLPNCKEIVGIPIPQLRRFKSIAD
jgi:hypothetical protein